MGRSGIAEFVLACVMPAERAVAVTGDFMEEASIRGSLWLWSSVVRTVLSRIAGDFLERPLTMIRVGGLGYLITLLFPLCVLGLLQIAVRWLSHSPGHSFGEPLAINTPPPSAPPKLYLAWPLQSIHFLWPVWFFLSGKWAARRAQGREAASALAVAGFGGLGILVYLAVLWRNGLTPDLTIYLQSVWHDVVLMAGALWARYRDVRQTWRAARG